jgi:hypothetical protein
MYHDSDRKQKMKYFLFTLVVFSTILLTSCQTVSPSQVPTQTTIPTDTAEPTNRTITIQNVSGTVELMGESQQNPHTPVAGETITVGTEIRTGTDGQVVLESDDGTIALITANSSFRLTVLKGTPANPLTRFLTDHGEIFAFRLNGQTLPPGAGFEVETPDGIAAIRGSSMGVSYLTDDSGSTTLVCLTGICTAESTSGQTMELEGGQRVEITTTGIVGSAIPLTEQDIQSQADALQVVQETGGETLSIDISYCNNEIGGETEIAANREYIAVTRPGCWATPNEALAMKSSVAVSMSVDGASVSFIGYGPTAECTPGGVSTGTYNFGAYYVIGPFTAGDYTVETTHVHGTEGFDWAEACILHAR